MEKKVASSHLLFFDTFPHETSDIVQLDLVQFKQAVQVCEVRVIPLGARVKADFPGGVRLGATNPGQFEIEFFVNDLSKRGAATFENIGNLNYTQHGNIQLEFDKKPPTDGLLLRGRYNTVTLAVYGTVTKVHRDTSPPKTPQARTDIVPQPPPEKVNTHERIRDWLEDTKRKQHAYELNPSEEEPPEWEPKLPTSPVELDDHKDWRESTQEGSREYDRERGKSVEKARNRERESWERSSSRKDNKRDGSRDKDNEKDRERVIERDKERDSDREGKIQRVNREIFEDDTRRKRSLDEWNDRLSMNSEDHSIRRPHTPLESPQPPLSNSPLIHSPLSEGVGRGAILPPPILSDEMEAISDDEDIPDIPVDDVTGPEFEEEPIEEDEPIVGGHTHIEEGNPETDVCEYEEIMSDEDDLPEYQYEEDYLVEEWEDWMKPFCPQDIVELPELLYIGSPATQTHSQLEIGAWKGGKETISTDERSFLDKKLSLLLSDTPLPSLASSKAVDADLSQDVPEETGEVWVQAAEQVCHLLSKGLLSQNSSSETEMFQTLFAWVDCGLDFDMAINQQQPVFKIRHMKAGIRLCSTLLQCSSNVTRCLLERGSLSKLFVLIDQPHLAVSIRLLILRAIDNVLSTPLGLQHFTTKKEVDGKSGYEKLLELLANVQQSRAKVACAVTVRKVHLLEICEKLYADVTDMIGFLSSVNEEEKQSELDNSDGQEFKKKENENLQASALWNSGLPCSLLQSILSCMKEILRTYNHANLLLVQPVRWLPESKQFQLPKHNENPYPYIYNVFKMSGLLEAISVLLVTPSANQNPLLLSSIKLLLNSLISYEHGLRFLAWERKATMVIIKALLQFGEDNRLSECESDSLLHLGVHLSTSLHVVHQLDCIASLQRPSVKRKPNSESSLPDSDQQAAEPDFSQAVVHFNTLESLLITPSGKEAVVAVIGMPAFTEILFPYLTADLGEENTENDPSKATCFGYVVDLLTVTIKFQDDARFLEVCGENLSRMISAEEKLNAKSEDCSKLSEVLPWVSIAKNPEVFTYDKLSNLANIVQDNLEKIDKFPGELISALRILCYLTIPQTPVGEFSSEDHNNELVEEIKYKYATMQLFSADMLTHLINLLNKLSAIYQQPFLQSSNFVGSEGGFVIMIVKPTLALLQNILSHIIEARNTDFKDLTAVIPLIQTYILLQAFPNQSPYFVTAQKLKQKVIDILLGYTQVIYTTEGEEVLSKSLWTLMMTEIFKYLLNAPHTMVSVITLITELLPLPLPIQTQIPLTQEETLHAVRVRKLWSAHLYSLASTLHELIHRLGLATHPLLTHSLRRMCVALSDLSAPMALLVAKAALDLLLQTHRLDQRALVKEEMKGTKEDSAPSTPMSVLTSGCGVPAAHASQQTTRALNMLASLVSHAPTKAAVIHLLRGGTPTLTHTAAKAEEKYCSLVTTWCSILILPGRENGQNHVHFGAQECLLIIIHYLLDYENAMQVNQGEVQQEDNFTSECSMMGVPHKDVLVPFIEALIDVIRSLQCPTWIIRQSLQIILRLLEHNYGFFYVKSVLDKKKSSLLATFRTLSANFSKENEETLALLKDLLFVCERLVSPDEGRHMCVSINELSAYLGWKNEWWTDQVLCPLKEKIEPDEERESSQKERREEDNERTHPLKVLEHLIVSEANDEEEAEHLYDEISQLILMLEGEGTASTVESCNDREEPPPVGLESLHVLFASRIVWTFPSGDDDLHSLWFSLPSFDDFEEKDAVSVNLLETCRKYAGDFDLVATLNKVIKGQGTHSISPQKIPKAIPKYKPSASAIRPDRRGRPYVAPMRGRAFGRGLNIRSDPFRSRPPNTSRPPSLHVDDFVALECTGHQPTGPTGYNKISFGRGKMMLDTMRVRGGRVRGDNRGRFFHRPHFRGDGRVLGRGIGMRRPPGWGFRGDGRPRGAFRGTPMNPAPPPRFIRGRPPFPRGMPGIPGGPKERFPPKFIERGRRGDIGGRHHRGFR